jgi:hypothetical protein
MCNPPEGGQVQKSEVLETVALEEETSPEEKEKAVSKIEKRTSQGGMGKMYHRVSRTIMKSIKTSSRGEDG